MKQRRPRSKSLPDRLREPPNKASRKEGRRRDATKASMMANTRLATALLDDIRTEQVAATAYDKTFYTQRFTKLCGSRLGLDPAETLCVPCMWLLSKPPPPRAFYNHSSVPKRHWKPHHDSLFQLIDCCLGVGRSGSACRLCMMLWQAICLAMQKARRDHGPRVVFAENYMHHVGKAYGLYRPDCFDKLCTILVADKKQLVLQPNIGLSTEHAPYTYSASCKLEITELEADRKGVTLLRAFSFCQCYSCTH